MERVVVEGVRDEGVAEFDSEYQVRRDPETGGIAEVGGDLAKAFERELDATVRGIRGGGAGAEGAEHAGREDERRRVERQYLTAMEHEIVSRLFGRGVLGASVGASKDAEGLTRLTAVAWGLGGVVKAETVLKLNCTVEDILAHGRGRGFIGQVVNLMAGSKVRAGVVL